MSHPALAPAGRLSPLLIVTVLLAAMLGCAGALWAYHGTTVFYEMIAAGIAYCF